MNLSLKRLNLRKQCSTVEFPMKNTNTLFLFETYVFAGKQETWIPLSVMPLLFPVLLVSLSVFILFVFFFWSWFFFICHVRRFVIHVFLVLK